jgi:hypothetical protein
MCCSECFVFQEYFVADRSVRGSEFRFLCLAVGYTTGDAFVMCLQVPADHCPAVWLATPGPKRQPSFAELGIPHGDPENGSLMRLPRNPTGFAKNRLLTPARR